jgi:fumarylpyruvate hydrolase
MIFSLAQLVNYIGTQFGLDAGDIIYTGTPAGVGPVNQGDVIELVWETAVEGTDQSFGPLQIDLL